MRSNPIILRLFCCKSCCFCDSYFFFAINISFMFDVVNKIYLTLLEAIVVVVVVFVVVLVFLFLWP